MWKTILVTFNWIVFLPNRSHSISLFLPLLFLLIFPSTENMNITLKTKTHLYEKDGHVFYNITGTQVDYTLSGLKLRLDNLFDGVKVLGEYTKLWSSTVSSIDLILAQHYKQNFSLWLFIYFLFFNLKCFRCISTEDSTNQYLNENWRPVSDALKPILAKTIEDILLVILNKVFHYIPADYLISDIARPSTLYG